MGIENMDFGKAHHSGMPTAKELRWRMAVIRAGIEARYGEEITVPASETITPANAIPSIGTIDNFSRPA